MNIAKHMEAIAVITIAVACLATYAADAIPAAYHHHATEVTSDLAIPTVTITAKRLSAAEKADQVS
jgi:hypothetical protein